MVVAVAAAGMANTGNAAGFGCDKVVEEDAPKLILPNGLPLAFCGDDVFSVTEENMLLLEGAPPPEDAAAFAAPNFRVARTTRRFFNTSLDALVKGPLGASLPFAIMASRSSFRTWLNSLPRFPIVSSNLSYMELNLF